MFVNRPNIGSRPNTSATTSRRGVGSSSHPKPMGGIIGKPPPGAPPHATNHSHGSSTSRLPSSSISLVSGTSSNRPSTNGGIPQLKTRSMSLIASSNGTSQGSGPGVLHSLARPPTAPSRILNPAVRGRSRFKFDDKTYISILKSDILRLQRKLDDLGSGGSLSARSSNSSSSSSSQTMDASKLSSSEEIEKFLNDFEFRAGCKTQNQMTKASLMDVLFEKMQLVEKYILEKTCDESESEFKKFDSSLSRIGLFFNLIEKTLKMHEKLTNHSHTPKGKHSKGQPFVAFEMPSFKVTTPPDHKLKHKQSKENFSGTQGSSLTTGGSKAKEENKRLKKQVAELKRKCQRMKETERDLNKQIKDLKDKHADGADNLAQDYKKRISDLESTVKDLQSLNDKQQQKYDKKSQTAKVQEKQQKSAIQSLEAEIGTLKEENQKLASSSKQMQSRISSMESDLEKAKVDSKPEKPNIDELQQQQKKHAKELDSLQKKYKQHQDDASTTISKLQQQCKDLEINLKKADLSEQHKKLQEKCRSLEKECAMLKKQLADNSQSNSSDMDALIRTEKELMDLKDAHKMKMKAHEVEIGKFKARIGELESETNQLQSASRELKLSASADGRELKRLRDIEEKYKQLQHEMRNMAHLQKQDEESLKRLTQMQEYLERMEKEYKDLQKELEKQLKRNEVLKSCDALYQESMQELRIERQKRKELEENLVSADRVRRLNEKVMNAEQVIREKNGTISKMEKKEASQEDAITRMRKEIQRLLDDVESRDQRIEQLEESKKEHMSKQQQPQENSRGDGTDLSHIMDHIKKADQSLNDVLVEELRTMRTAFHEKLKLATEEIERIKKFHKQQLLEMQEVVSRERQVNDKKLQQLRDRCDMLTKAVEAIKVKYQASISR
mmetsp:Transcript_4373/g.16473  ORF Transcript_4373/g.16473 Transcript_4373/m.16473 type:complete len:898 (-) Transcript_4373:7388-10081(-)